MWCEQEIGGRLRRSVQAKMREQEMFVVACVNMTVMGSGLLGVMVVILVLDRICRQNVLE